MPRRCALLAALEGLPEPLVSDASWRAWEERAYRADTPRMANHQSFIEWYDARLGQHGWQAPEFDDRAWPTAHAIPADQLAPWGAPAPRTVPLLTLVPRLPARIIETGLATPLPEYDPAEPKTLHLLLATARRRPAPLVQASPGGLLPLTFTAPADPRQAAYAILDFAENAAGYLVYELEGTPGTIVDCGYGEHCDDGRVACAAQGVRYVDRMVLGVGRLHYQLMLPKTLRYLLLEVRQGQATLHAVRHDVSTCPVRWDGRFTAPAAPALAAIWQAGAHTVQQCMEDIYMDTPRRERAGWLGDFLPEAMATYHAFGETRLARHSLELFLASQQPAGYLIGRYPSNDGPNMPSFTADFTPAVADYVRHSGDVAFARACWPGIARVTAWFEQQRTADDLLVVTPTRRDPAQGYGYVLIDWAPLQLDGAVTAMVMHYLHHLEEAAWLAGMLEYAAAVAQLSALAERTRAALRTHCFDPARGVFVNCVYEGRRSVRRGYQENLLALLWDIATPAQAAALSRALLPPDQPLPILTADGAREYEHIAGGTYPWDDAVPVPLGSPYFDYFALAALFETGRGELALCHLRERYGALLARGSTTVWEDWAGEASRSHGWGAAATTVLGRYVLGVAPVSPGFAHCTVLPTPAGLPAAQGRVPTPHGAIQVAWEATGEGLVMELLLPPGVTALAGLPGKGTLLVNGQPAEAIAHHTRRGLYQAVTLPAGEHRLRLVPAAE
jgi:hypothetical protein